jgi:hypothetical protein
MRRFTATQYHMAKHLDRKIKLAKETNRRLLALLLHPQASMRNAARLELDRRKSVALG